MKTKIFLSIVAASLAPAMALLAGQVVSFSDLPANVQQAINNQRGPSGIALIQRLDRPGPPVYDVRLDQEGPNNEFLVTDTGALLDPRNVISNPISSVREVLFNSLPTPIQNAIRAQVGNVPVQPVEVVTANGQTTYVVPSRVDDRLIDLWIDPNGNILTLSPPRVLLSNSRRVTPDELPAAVQETLRYYSNGAPITRLQKGMAQGLIVYEAHFNQAGRPVDLRIADDGALIRDAVNDRFLAETGRMTRAGLAANAPVRAPLRDAESISFNQLPLPVLSALQNYAGADFVERIEKGIAQGQVVYEALFRHAGQEIPLRLGADGSFIHDRPNEMFLAQFGRTPVLPGTAVGTAPAYQSQSGTIYVPAR